MLFDCLQILQLFRDSRSWADNLTGQSCRYYPECVVSQCVYSVNISQWVPAWPHQYNTGGRTGGEICWQPAREEHGEENWLAVCTNDKCLRWIQRKYLSSPVLTNQRHDNVNRAHPSLFLYCKLGKIICAHATWFVMPLLTDTAAFVIGRSSEAARNRETKRLIDENLSSVIISNDIEKEKWSVVSRLCRSKSVCQKVFL